MQLIQDIEARYSEEFRAVDSWCQSNYDANFSQYFENVKTLYVRMASESNPITDAELEQILIELPLQLFAAAEAVNAFKAKLEVIKLRIKQKKHEVLRDSELTSQAARREEAEYETISDEMFVKAYSSVIDRVDREMTYARELIMSAKKVWSARRQAEGMAREVEPTADLPDLPEVPATKDQYIK